MIRFKCKFSYSAGQYDTCSINAFCESAARILAMVKGAEMYPNNKGILIESVEADSDWLNKFNDLTK